MNKFKKDDIIIREIALNNFNIRKVLEVCGDQIKTIRITGNYGDKYFTFWKNSKVYDKYRLVTAVEIILCV